MKYVKGLISIIGVYLFLGFGSGIFLASRGFSELEVALYASMVYSGIAQFMVGDIVLQSTVLPILVAIFFISFRHFFYLLHFSQLIEEMPLWKKIVLALQVTDETYLYMTAVVKRPITFRIALTLNLLCYVSWFLGSVFGVIFIREMSMLMELEMIDFLASSMFIGIFYYAYREIRNRILGLLLSVSSFGLVILLIEFIPKEIVYLLVSLILAFLAMCYTIYFDKDEKSSVRIP